LELTAPYIESHLNGILPEFDAYLVDVHLNRGHRRLVVQVLVDTDAGITIGQCAEISRRLGKILDEDTKVDGSYELEVSSPGIDRPLKLLRQYRKNVGRTFRVTKNDAGARGQIEGTLEAVEGDELTFRTGDTATVTIRFTDIMETKEVLPW
jgi:ribosome maturation factor RimP